MRIQGGGGGGGGVGDRGSQTPLKKHKNIGFLSNTGHTGPDPLKNHKATIYIKPAFNVGPSRAHQ